MRTLDENDIESALETIQETLRSQVGSNISGTGQAFGADLIGIIASKVVVPLLISLTSRTIYEALKERVLGTGTRVEAEKATRELIGAEINDSEDLDPVCLEEIRQELQPLGVTEEQIVVLYRSIRKKLVEKAAMRKA